MHCSNVKTLRFLFALGWPVCTRSPIECEPTLVLKNLGQCRHLLKSERTKDALEERERYIDTPQFRFFSMSPWHIIPTGENWKADVSRTAEAPTSISRGISQLSRHNYSMTRISKRNWTGWVYYSREFNHFAAINQRECVLRLTF